MAMYGVDVSYHNRGLSLAGTGAAFVIVKATDGTRFVDRCCDPFVQEAKRLGLMWGFYHFANGLHKSSMRAQADYFLDNCANYFGEGVPCLDWEDSDEKYGGAVVKYGPGAAKEWLDRVYERTGVRPMIYMNASVASSYDWSEVARDYVLWGAGYPTGSTYDRPGTGWYGWGAWGFPAIHQYSSAGGLDRNKAYIDGGGWARLVAGGKADMTDEQAQMLKDIWDIVHKYMGWQYKKVDDGDGVSDPVDMHQMMVDNWEAIPKLLATEAAQTEAIKALAKMRGADPEAVAKAVSDAVAAKLRTIRLDVTTSE
jgi:GH25 family lysozyme M1 (1,4-beta-N-acetylmuramidase)